MDFSHILSIALLVFGFGFVIFWHELGHFLAAKYVGVRVEQFAVGMFHAIFSYRRGVGVKIGSTRAIYEAKTNEWLQAKGETPKGPDGNYSEYQRSIAAEALGLGETEYRLSWLPLGGYVKPTGQDDLRPAVAVGKDDPHSFGAKTVGQRMLIISAGVIMNLILAAILFMALFLHGFNAPAPRVGNIIPGSPAAEAGLQVGDEVVSFDGAIMHDFTKIQLATALANDDWATEIVVKRNGEQITRIIRPRKADGDDGFLMLGIAPAYSMTGPNPKKVKVNKDLQDPQLLPPDLRAIEPGDEVIAINGQSIDPKDPNAFLIFDQAVQQSGGKPVELTIRRHGSGEVTTASIPINIQPKFQHLNVNDRSTPDIAGMIPLTSIGSVMPESPVRGKLLPGDVFVGFSTPAGKLENPRPQDITKFLDDAGKAEHPVTVTVRRPGQAELVTIEVEKLINVGQGRYGIGVGLNQDFGTPILAGTYPDTPAADAGLMAGQTIESVNGAPVQTWFDVHAALKQTPADQKAKLVIAELDQPVELELSPAHRESLAALRYGTRLVAPELGSPIFDDLIQRRSTHNPLLAMWWGVTETRDLILQFYVTLHRMFSGEVSYKHLMGPVGIFHAGSKFAAKGNDWLLWFLAMISANLAVVNFLPIPIVDGGLFLFLIIEKLTGRPLSPKAQNVAQIVGLALLLSIFVLVTYQDIARFF
jgi:regulator of sigma E protease